MRTLVFDIETVGEEYDKMDIATQEVLTHWLQRTASTEEDYIAGLKNIQEGLGFSPYTGAIVAIGLYDIEQQKAVAYYHAPGAEYPVETFDSLTLRQMTEKNMLEAFWKGVLEYNTFVSFNGRSFDLPFMHIRSAVHRIRPTINLLKHRYLSSEHQYKHIDLLDQLSFYGAVWKGKPNLHLACRAFGIESPKAEGVMGSDVAELFRSASYQDIARYCIRDCIATSALYQHWDRYLRM